MLVIRSQAKVYLNTFLPNNHKKKQTKKNKQTNQPANKQANDTQRNGGETIEKTNTTDKRTNPIPSLIAFLLVFARIATVLQSTRANRIPWKYRGTESDKGEKEQGKRSRRTRRKR